MTQPIPKRHHLVVYWRNNSGSHGSFGDRGSKGIPSTKGSWGHPNDAKADFKGPFNSTTSDKHLKRERSISNRSYDSWNKAKKRL